jgi:hypothetical protein
VAVAEGSSGKSEGWENHQRVSPDNCRAQRAVSVGDVNYDVIERDRSVGIVTNPEWPVQWTPIHLVEALREGI